MASVNDLRRQKARMQRYANNELERETLKRDIFQLKHGGKMRVLRRIGSVTGSGLKKIGSGAVKYAEYYQSNVNVPTRPVRKRKDNSSGSIW